MKYLHIKNSPILKQVFLGGVDGALIVYEDNGSGISQDDLLDYQCTSWDGEIHWYPKESGEKLLEFSQEWIQNNLSRMEDGYDDTISNCLFYKKTLTGYLFIDSQLDRGSILEDMFHDFYIKYPEYSEDKNIYYLSDCHLVDNLVLGRNSCYYSNKTLIHLYKEGVLTDDIFYNNFENIFETQCLDSDNFKGNIVLTGTFKMTRNEMVEAIESAGLTVSEKINKNSWLWIGDKPGKNKLNAAQKLELKVSNLDDLMAIFSDDEKQEYLFEKIQDAIKQANLPLIEDIIQEQFDIHYNHDGALVYSIENEQYDIAKYLIDQGANIIDAKEYGSPIVNKWFLENALVEKNNHDIKI